MKTAQEILKHHLLSIDNPNIKKNVFDRWEQFKKEESTIAIVSAMKEYAKQALEEAHSKIACLDWNVMNNDVDGKECLNQIELLINQLK